MPWNIIPEEELSSIENFTENYAAQFGLLQPAAPRDTTSPSLLTYLATRRRHSRPQPISAKLRRSHENGESMSLTSSLRCTSTLERTSPPTGFFVFLLLS